MNILSLPYKTPTDPIDPFIGRVIYEAFPSRFGRDGLKYHLAAGGRAMIVSRWLQNLNMEPQARLPCVIDQNCAHRTTTAFQNLMSCDLRRALMLISNTFVLRYIGDSSVLLLPLCDGNPFTHASLGRQPCTSGAFEIPV